MLAVSALDGSEKDHRMSAFAPSDIIVPENFHEVARLSLREIGKVTAKPKFIKQSRRPWAVRVPTSPHALSIMLIPDNQLIQGGEIELQLAAVAQLFDGSNENQIGRSRAETHIRFRRNDEKLSGFEMRGGLQFYFCNV